MKNRKNNKGFSLVELIVVIAVMAVLVGVLAPAYLRYVEKAKMQKDVSAVGEVVEAIKIAAAEEDVSSELSSELSFTIEDNKTIDTGKTKLTKELKATVGDSIDFTSTAMNEKKVAITIARDAADYALTITVGGEGTTVKGDALEDLEKLSETAK